MEEHNSSSIGTALLAFTGGALLGAGIALLFAPQSGRMTRRKLGRMVEDVEEGAQDMAHQAAQGIKDAGQKGSQWLENVKDYVSHKKSELADVVDGAKK